MSKYRNDYGSVLHVYIQRQTNNDYDGSLNVHYLGQWPHWRNCYVPSQYIVTSTVLSQVWSESKNG